MDYDYIVVGAGAGGGPVAANLALAGFRVLLLEAGGADDGVIEQVPAFHASASEDPRISWPFCVRHYQDDARTRLDPKAMPCPEDPARTGIYYPRAATIGGCTQHHAMIIMQPHPQDWDAIAAATGDPTWGAGEMHRYFARIERCEYRPLQRVLQRLLGWNPSGHGFDGWLTTTLADPKLVIGDSQIAEIIIDSAHYALGHVQSRVPHWWRRLVRTLLTKADPNDWQGIKRDAVGVRQVPLSVAQGRRHGVRERLLAVRDAHPGRLTIRTHALVTRLLFDERPGAPLRVTGCEYFSGAHLYRVDPLAAKAPDVGNAPRTEQAHATREVILCGGAFNTPQLLQLSGIGPPDVLAAAGVALRHALPGVGANLQDRYEVSVVFRMRTPFGTMAGASMTADPNDPHFQAWERGEGIYTTNGAVLGVIDRSIPEQTAPDLFLFALLTDFRGYYPGYSERIREARRYLTWTILKAHTGNTAGRVAIRSPDPRQPPSIDFHYFDEGNAGDDADLAAVVNAVRRVRRMVRRYAGLIEAEEVPGPQVHNADPARDYQALADFVRNEAWGHHASCTCRIGGDNDPMAVLDSRFRVRGVANLRIVDASVFPRTPGLFMVTPVHMIAEKASDAIIADAGGPPEGTNPPARLPAVRAPAPGAQ